MKRIVLVILVTLASLLTGCGGSSNATTNPVYPQISGAWEIIATSSNPGGNAANQTRLETAFSQNEGNITSQNTLLEGLNFFSATNDYAAGLFEWSQGGNCFSFEGPPVVNSLTGTIDTHNSFTFALSESGFAANEKDVPFTGSGTLQPDGTLSGTYSGGGAVCPDSGTFVGKTANSLTGNYQIEAAWPCSFCGLTISLAESSGGITGQWNDGLDAAFPITGQAVGNEGQISGTVVTGPNAGNLFTYNLLLVYDEQNAPLLLAYGLNFDFEVLSKQ